MWYGPDLLDNPTAKDAVAEFKAKDVDPEARTLYSYPAVQIMKQAAEGRDRLIRRKWREPRIRA